MNDNYENENTPNFFIGCCAVGVVCLFTGIVISAGDGDAVGFVVGLLMGLIAFLVGFFGDSNLKERRFERERAQHEAFLQEQRRREEKAWNDLCASGNWDFPVDDFYKACLEHSVTNTADSYCINKAIALANTILEKEKVPREFHNLYVDKDKVKKYFSAGKKNAYAKQAKKQQERERKMREPQKAKTTQAERTEISHASELINKHGMQKRLTMLFHESTALSEILWSLTREIERRKKQEEEEARDAAIKLGVALMEASQTSTKSWGLSAGLADSIAPGLGTAVALETMQENARIELRNQQNRAYYKDMTAKMVNAINNDASLSTDQLEKEKEKLQEKSKRLEQEKQVNRQKIVLEDVSFEELKKHITVNHAYVKRRESNVLEVGVDIENAYVPNVPKDVKIVVDGTLTAEIFHGDIHVGTAHAPLPLYGVPCGGKTRITALCPYYLEGQPDYRVEYKVNDLWAMDQ